jgi:3-deoxy-D-manno-octulosonic-acid transferase
LVADASALRQAETAVKGRKVWVAASTHPGDEAEALANKIIVQIKEMIG